MEEYLGLLGTCRRDLTPLRAVFADLLAGCRADAEPYTPQDEGGVRRLLQKPGPGVVRPVVGSLCRRARGQFDAST
ncbi:hypothetical protein ACFV28_20690 [Streptomyces sp. NPDC059720]|uniref:hypothetical protein n=1 Tax=Streptomyces sp. NPDC059720 TaxID=3346924 RepID=UPI0036C23DDF